MDGEHPRSPDVKAKPLGNRLKADREFTGLSLRAAAAKAEISSAYLSQLEAGSVKGPSPHVLYRLAELYQSSYADLMTLAGYLLPATEAQQEERQAGALEFALRSRVPLTENERNALAEYLAWYRSRRGRPPEDL
jgi:transcriptional regulator with XRE-family HTH domain